MPRKKEWSVEEILNLFSPDQIKTADKALLPITVSPAIWRSILKHLSSGQAKESGLDEADEMDEAWWQNHVRKLTEKHERQIDHNESFYAVRIQAISDLAKQHGIWDEVAAILANGKVSPEDPPTYDHMLAREKARADKAEANYRWMVERAADQRLDGYRELGAKCAALEAERDEGSDV
jgi:hypothetical protein